MMSQLQLHTSCRVSSLTSQSIQLTMVHLFIIVSVFLTMTVFNVQTAPSPNPSGKQLQGKFGFSTDKPTFYPQKLVLQ